MARRMDKVQRCKAGYAVLTNTIELTKMHLMRNVREVTDDQVIEIGRIRVI